ncbi:MAG: DNA polymerase-3 subunit epsilon [Nonlabens sp.]|jgi:DNA polymerase-3 subunit epsilon
MARGPVSAVDAQLRLDDDARSLIDTTFVVLDLETTGLRPDIDRITEVGAVKVRGGEVLGELQTLVHPGVGLTPTITAVTGITNAMLAQAPTIAGVLPSLLEFLRGAVLVAHNARFDTGFLNAELVRHGYPTITNDVVDTAKLARRLVRDEVRDVRLATLARHFRSRVQPSHRALSDARATVDVLHGLLERAGSIGATTVEDLLDFQRSRSTVAFRKVSLAQGAPDAPGVYRFHDADDHVLYVGKATQLRSRIRQYFGRDDRRRMDAMVRETARVSWTVTPTPIEAAVIELRELALRRPRYNRASTHPPAPVWLRLTDEAFPRLSVVRAPGPDPTRELGPLAGRRSATAIIEAVEEVVRVRRCTFTIRAAQDHAPCILKEMGRCGAPCDATMGRDAYAGDIAALRALVNNDPTEVLRALTLRMTMLSHDERFEDAADVRQRLHAVATSVDRARRTTALAELERLEVARVGSDHIEAIRTVHGRLVGSARVARRHGVAGVRDALTQIPDALAVESRPDARADHTRGELQLLADWVQHPSAVLLSVDGVWTHPIAGGAAAAAGAAQARSVARQARRDDQLLAGEKITRRRDPQTSSNQDDQASGGPTPGPGSRPVHDARTR